MVLNNSRADLYTDLKKLHEANVKLREKNLSLSHELHMRSKENCEMKVQWDKDRSRNKSNVRQLERLQKDVIQRSARTISMEENDSEDDTIASMKYEVAKDTSEVDVVQDEEMKTLVDTGADTMTQIKQNLQIQQDQILSALKTLQLLFRRLITPTTQLGDAVLCVRPCFPWRRVRRSLRVMWWNISATRKVTHLGILTRSLTPSGPGLNTTQRLWGACS